MIHLLVVVDSQPQGLCSSLPLGRNVSATFKVVREGSLSHSRRGGRAALDTRLVKVLIVSGFCRARGIAVTSLRTGSRLRSTRASSEAAKKKKKTTSKARR